MSPEEMIWGDRECAGPDTRYMMQWGGAWRPVTHMMDGQGIPTTLAQRAIVAVLFIELEHWVTAQVYPGEIVERYDRDPKARRWEKVD